MNFGNKNSSCTYTKEDLAFGYGVAVSSSISVALALRMMTAGMTRRATGKNLLMLNTFVGCTASGIASFCNTYAMRSAEINKGIEVYKNHSLTEKLGISKIAAKNAVVETALSRTFLSTSAIIMPTVLLLGLGGVGISPATFAAKTALDTAVFIAVLRVGLPASISMFPPTSELPATSLEPEFHTGDKTFFSKGL